MNYFITAAGLGSRFLKESIKPPKPLIKVRGKEIINHVVNMFGKIERVIFICNEEHLNDKNLKKKNYLFVDGRYTIQAKSQSGSNFDVVEIHKKLPWKVLKHRIKLGYNPYCFTSMGLKRYFKNCLCM